jgi:hypothetical protein
MPTCRRRTSRRCAEYVLRPPRQSAAGRSGGLQRVQGGVDRDGAQLVDVRIGEEAGRAGEADDLRGGVTMGEVIAATGLVKPFGSTRALDGLDLSTEGEVHGFPGPTGAIESTTIRVLLLAFGMIAGTFGPLFDLPDRVLDLSPFALPAAVPLEAVHPTPLLALTAAGGIGVALGLLAFRRREPGRQPIGTGHDARPEKE